MGSSSGAGIQEITSIDGSVTITNPTGPTTDLSVTVNSNPSQGPVNTINTADGAGAWIASSWTLSGNELGNTGGPAEFFANLGEYFFRDENSNDWRLPVIRPQPGAVLMGGQGPGFAFTEFNSGLTYVQASGPGANSELQLAGSGGAGSLYNAESNGVPIVQVGYDQLLDIGVLRGLTNRPLVFENQGVVLARFTNIADFDAAPVGASLIKANANSATWAVVGGGGSPAAPFQSVQFNDAGSFGGSASWITAQGGGDFFQLMAPTALGGVAGLLLAQSQAGGGLAKGGVAYNETDDTVTVEATGGADLDLEVDGVGQVRFNGSEDFDGAAVGTVLTKIDAQTAGWRPGGGGGGGGLGIRMFPLALANDTYFFGNGGDGVFEAIGAIAPSDGTVNRLLVWLQQAGSGTFNVGLYDSTGALIQTSTDGYKAPVAGANIFTIPDTALNGSEVYYLGCCSRLNGAQFRGVTGALSGGPTPFIAIRDQNGNGGASMRASFDPNSGSTNTRMYGVIGNT